jgi:hypothetical protein
MPNKALQLTPSRTAPVFYDRSAFPFTFFAELGRPFGVAELGVSLLKFTSHEIVYSLSEEASRKRNAAKFIILDCHEAKFAFQISIRLINSFYLSSYIEKRFRISRVNSNSFIFHGSPSFCLHRTDPFSVLDICDPLSAAKKAEF